MSVAIRIYKSEKRLEAFQGGKRILQCDICLGFGANDGPKQREGDGRTPEGAYYICTRNAASRFYLSLGLSYPNARDAKEALLRGEIDKETFLSLVRAEKEKIRPDWNTPLGGYIMLHGEHPKGKAGDWTAGCIALSNEHMKRLFALAEAGDPVEILP